MTTLPGYPCAVCRRATGGPESVTVTTDKAHHRFCCLDCARLHMTRKLDPDETAAALKGGEAAGAYLDRIGKSDLAALSEREWAEFCGTLYAGACAELRRVADDAIPF